MKTTGRKQSTNVQDRRRGVKTKRGTRQGDHPYNKMTEKPASRKPKKVVKPQVDVGRTYIEYMTKKGMNDEEFWQAMKSQDGPRNTDKMKRKILDRKLKKSKLWKADAKRKDPLTIDITYKSKKK